MKLYLIIAGGCWMLGEGARMVIMAIFQQSWYYQPNAFDLLFDWVPLMILGTLIFYEGVKSFSISTRNQGKAGRGKDPIIKEK